MKSKRGRLGLCGFEGVDRRGMSGGLALYWHEFCLVEILGTENRYIDALVRITGDSPQWRLT